METKLDTAFEAFERRMEAHLAAWEGRLARLIATFWIGILATIVALLSL